MNDRSMWSVDITIIWFFVLVNRHNYVSLRLHNMILIQNTKKLDRILGACSKPARLIKISMLKLLIFIQFFWINRYYNLTFCFLFEILFIIYSATVNISYLNYNKTLYFLDKFQCFLIWIIAYDAINIVNDSVLESWGHTKIHNKLKKKV